VVGWPFYRYLLSWAANVYCRLLLWLPTHDCTSGYRCYTRDLLTHIKLDEVVSHFRERGGFVWVPWSGDAECEDRLKAETGGVTIRTIDSDAKPSGKCFVCGKPAKFRVALAKAY